MWECYYEKLKRNLVQSVNIMGKVVIKLVKKMNFTEKSLHNWGAIYKWNNARDTATSAMSKVSIHEVVWNLQKKVLNLEEENQILKKTIGIFSKNQK